MNEDAIICTCMDYSIKQAKEEIKKECIKTIDDLDDCDTGLGNVCFSCRDEIMDDSEITLEELINKINEGEI